MAHLPRRPLWHLPRRVLTTLNLLLKADRGYKTKLPPGRVSLQEILCPVFFYLNVIEMYGTVNFVK